MNSLTQNDGEQIGFSLHQLLLAMLIAAISISCTMTRSISDSGYHGTQGYRGELNELEVLGVNPTKEISDADIQSALASEAKVSLKRGDRIVLVQSGATFPDEPMLSKIQMHYPVVPLSGEPALDPRNRRSENPAPRQPIDRALRLAAAKAGAETMIVYWGILESGREEQGTKVVSWVPIVGNIVPDERQHMRIRLKAAVINVATGAWEFVTAEVKGDSRTSARINRKGSDQKQVLELKAKGYELLAASIVTRFN